MKCSLRLFFPNSINSELSTQRSSIRNPFQFLFRSLAHIPNIFPRVRTTLLGEENEKEKKTRNANQQIFKFMLKKGKRMKYGKENENLRHKMRTTAEIN
jgi:hypothetical protein